MLYKFVALNNLFGKFLPSEDLQMQKNTDGILPWVGGPQVLLGKWKQKQGIGNKESADSDSKNWKWN